MSTEQNPKDLFSRIRWLVVALLHLSPLAGIGLGRPYLTLSLALIALVPYIKCKKMRAQGVPDSDPALQRWEYLTINWLREKF